MFAGRGQWPTRLAIAGRLDRHTDPHAGHGQRGQDRRGAPKAGRDRFQEALGPNRTGGSFGAHAAFIEKHQKGGIQLANLLPPGLGAPQVLAAILLCAQSDFYDAGPEACRPNRRNRVAVTTASQRSSPLP